MFNLFDLLGIKMNQEFINTTITPPCVALLIMGFLSIREGVKEFREVRKTGVVTWTPIISGGITIGLAFFYFFLWVVWR